MKITEKEVLNFFKTLGWSVEIPEVKEYAIAVAEHMAYSPEPYSLKDWYKDTKEFYPEDIEEMERY